MKYTRLIDNFEKISNLPQNISKRTNPGIVFYSIKQVGFNDSTGKAARDDNNIPFAKDKA